MHMPGSGSAGAKVDDADDSLLYHLALTFQIFSQDLAQLRPWGLRPRDLRHGWDRCCDPREVKQIAADDFHRPPLNLLASFDRASLCALRICASLCAPRI